MRKIAWIMTFVLVAGLTYAAPPARFMAEPDINGKRIVFSYEGDLWMVPETGGTATRLTSFPGTESSPKFSPDGKWIAFSGNYDGAQAVYKMPAEGGEPIRLTWNPGRAKVLDWTPDGKRIVFSSYMKTFIYRDPKLFSVKADGTAPEQLPLDRGVLVGFNSDGSEMLYCRKGNPEYQWKRYRGGLYVDIWRYNFKTRRFSPVTDFVGKNTYPMWVGNTMVFVSDRGAHKVCNIFEKNLATGDVKQITHYDKLDVMMAGHDGSRMVYVQDGTLHVLNVKSRKVEDISVRVPSDRWRLRDRVINPEKYVHFMDVSNDGKTALLEARGDVYAVPSDKKEDTLNLSASSASRERLPRISPDGKWVCFFSDRTGEYQLYKQSIGGGPWFQLTDGRFAYPYRPAWSPDGKKILFGTKHFRIYVLDVASKKLTKVDEYHQLKNDEFYWEIDDYGWAPDSNWICYTTVAENRNSMVKLYRISDGKRVDLTDDFYDNLNPRFDKNGDYLYYLSSRNFNVQMDFYEDDHILNSPYTPVAVQLRAGEKPPFADLAAVPGGDETEKPGKEDKEKKTTPEFRIDLAQLSSRTFPLPVRPGNYLYLKAGNGKVAWGSVDKWVEHDYDAVFKPNRSTKVWLHIFDMGEKEEVKLPEEVQDFRLSPDGSQLITHKSGGYQINAVDKAYSQKKFGKAVDLSKMVYTVQTMAEYNQIFNDAWRWWRDFFYDKNLHGHDWKKLGEQYRAYIPYVTSRNGLNWLISQMVGEVSVGHAYIFGGDQNRVRQPENRAKVYPGLLGADLVPDRKAGRYRFGTIFGPTKYNLDVTSPLARPDVGVKEGDYLIAINDHNIIDSDNWFRYVQVVSGETISLTVSNRADGKDGRTFRVTPVFSERQLRYVHWLAHNIDYVLKKTNGQVGYMHINDMSDRGIGEFDKFWRAFRYKKGIIIDVRRNSGGWTEYFLIDKLERKMVAYNVLTDMNPMRYPGAASTAKYVAISNEYNGSDGEAFIQHFKAQKMGKVIGVPSWGGLVGIINGQLTVDNGTVYQPNNSFYGKEGKWWVENHGADPDITLDNDPGSVVAGKDPQLDKAIEVVLEEMKKAGKPEVPVQHPAYPIR
jgi:tricorn protease